MALLDNTDLHVKTDNIVDFPSNRNVRPSLHILPLSPQQILRKEIAEEYLSLQETMRLVNIELYKIIAELETLEPTLETTRIINDFRKRIFRNTFSPSLPSSLIRLKYELESLKKNAPILPLVPQALE